MDLTSAEIVQARLARQQLSGSGFDAPAEIVRWFGAMQAQEYALSKWAIGLRLPQLKDDDIERAFAEGHILRTHLLRPTWHFVAPEDIRWMLRLTAPHVQAGNAYMYRKMELETRLFKKCNKLIERLLGGGRQLSRAQIGAAFKSYGIAADGLQLSLIMMQAELEGLICSGARKGNQFTYALLEERVPPAPDRTREEALATLANRYFSSRGPAAISDFTTWSGLSVKDARSGIGMIENQLLRQQSGGQEYYSSNQFSPDRHSPGIAYLLPPYDEYIMGYKNRDAIRPPGKTPVKLHFYNMIILDGQVAGSWRRTSNGRTIDLEHHFLKPGRKLATAFSQAASRFEAFVGLPLHLIEK